MELVLDARLARIQARSTGSVGLHAGGERENSDSGSLEGGLAGRMSAPDH
ncbi:hypothetical protein [Asaia spathodeae]|uniref:Uncharacterized protein n=1 Tax=Asaia spathodeae TaxID=657016 RepID=A0ABX2P4C4_9PROT|nr:hypothetical protein [Asaia spathodeae]